MGCQVLVAVALTCPCSTRAGRSISAALAVVAFVAIAITTVVEGRRRARRDR